MGSDDDANIVWSDRSGVKILCRFRSGLHAVSDSSNVQHKSKRRGETRGPHVLQLRNGMPLTR